MDTKKLRQKVLDLAIRGKLVPQDPNDEPASMLLERIQAEKQKLIAEGKIKKEKRTSFIFKGEDNSYYEKEVENGKETITDITDEIPFDIPENWAWCRLGSVCELNPKNNAPDSLEASFVPMQLIKDGMCNEFSFVVKKWKDIKKGYTHFADGDIGFAKITPCFENKKSAIFLNLKNGIGAGTTELFILRPYLKQIAREYIFYFLKRDDFIFNGVCCYKGAVGQQRVSSEFVRNTLIPIPPTNEQKLIVTQIHNLLEILGNIDTEKVNFLEKISLTKSKLLDIAIRGKLLPQDITDEPASKLLEKIRKEKEATQTSKGKRKTTDSYIFKGEDNLYYRKSKEIIDLIDDELPYELPKNWQWAQLSDVCNLYTGNSISKEVKAKKYTNIKSGYNYIGTKDVGFDNQINYNNGVKIPFSEEGFKIAPKSSVLLCIEGGSAGRKIGIINEDVCFGNKLCCFYSKVMCNDFIYLYLQSPTFKRLFKESLMGLIGGVGTGSLEKIYIPIPPIDEQKRISEFLGMAFKQLDSLIHH